MAAELRDVISPVKAERVYRIQALDRAFLLVGALADSDTAIGLGDLSKRVGLHKSTVHRMIMVLERHGYIERDDATGTYRLGWKLCELGMRAAARADVAVVARPMLEQLVKATGETAHIGVLRAGDMVSLAFVESSRQLRSPATVGRRSAAYTTAMGKTILAFAPPWEVEHYLSTTVLKPFTSNTITTSKQFRAVLQKVRELGYALDDEEFEDGLRCVAAPVRDYSGKVIAGIGIAGPASRLPLDHMDVISGHVMLAASGLSERLGFRIDAPFTPERGERVG